MTAWAKEGLLKGYSDGTLRPDRTISRGEAAALVNRSFGFSEEAQIHFSDLTDSNWAYGDISKAVKAGYLQGFSDGTVGVQKELSRQEAAIMITRLLNSDTSQNTSSISNFTDAALIPLWSQGAIGAAAAANIMQGYNDGTFRPTASITRSEFVVMLERALGTLSIAEYIRPGTYGPSDGKQLIQKNVVVRSSDVILQNMKISGDLIIAESVKEGNVWLKNVTVAGTTTIQGGGTSSVHIDNSTLAVVIVDKAAGSVRVAVNAQTKVSEVIVKSPVILEQTDSGSDAPFSLVKLTDALPSGSIVTMIGRFDKVEVAGKEIVIDFLRGLINQFSVFEQAANTKMNMGKEAKIILLILNTLSNVTGSGVIEKASLRGNAKGSTFETQPIKTEYPDAQSGNGNSGGDSSVPNVPVSITSVSASNGAIRVVFNRAPDSEPTVNDFSIKQSINQSVPLSVKAIAVEWDAAAKTASIIVPSVTTTGIAQSVKYEVRYKNAQPVESTEMIVAGGTVIAENGDARAILVIPTDADQQIVGAAQTLKKYVQKSTGADLLTKTAAELTGLEPTSNEAVKIYIGFSPDDDMADHQAMLEDMDGDGFIIDSQEDRITIIGASTWGTEYGVYDFLERYVGISWLMPGPDGEDVPQHLEIAVPQEIVRNNPAAISRQFFGTEIQSSYIDWARHNRLRSNIRFHHNMDILFDPAIYADHPDFYPNHTVPTHPYDWQPCFSNPDTVTAAIARINEYFDMNPNEVSFPLGINDSENYCESNPNHPNYPGKLNSMGKLDMSDIYYNWVNQVVEGVLEKHPDIYFGVLAYLNVYDPPSFPLHPRVTPYITYDRLTWIDPIYGNDGKQHMTMWQPAANSLGWYEYLFGWPYTLPRVYPHEMAENYKYARDHGVIGHVAELAPNFGEGPKTWLSAKLQWDPDQNVDVLLNEWYVRAVGPESAPYLQQYYEHWEEFWTTRMFTTNWYKQWTASSDMPPYLPFYDSSFLTSVTKEEIADSRYLMEQVVANAQTDKQKARAEILMHAFEYYEASALSFPREEGVTALQNSEQALALLADSVTSMEMAQRRIELFEAFKTDPVLMPPPVGYKGADWSGLSNSVLTALLDWVVNEPEGGAVREQLAQLAVSSPMSIVRDNANLLLAVANGETNLFPNSSFETDVAGDPQAATPWWYWGLQNGGETYRTDLVARTGSHSIKMTGLAPGGVVLDDIKLSLGKYAVVYHYYMPADTEATGMITWFHNILGEQGGVIANLEGTMYSPNATKGRWVAATYIFDVTESAFGKKAGDLQMGVKLLGFSPGETLYVDDISLYKLSDPTKITKVAADNGQIQAVIEPEPAANPTITDFSIQVSIDGWVKQSVTPTSLSWDRTTRTATIEVPRIPSGAHDKTVEVSVSYKGMKAVDSAPYIVAANVYALNLLQNPSFEKGSTANMSDIPSWVPLINDKGTVSRTKAFARTDEYSLVSTGVSSAGGALLQLVPFEPGTYEAVLYFRTPANSLTKGTISWYTDLRDKDLNYIKPLLDTERVSAASSNGDWTELRTTFMVTPEANATWFNFGFNIWDFEAGEELYVDDVSLRKLTDPTKIISAQAANGRLEAVFNQEPTESLSIEDFAVQMKVDGGAAILVNPTSLSWDADVRTVSLTIPYISAGASDKSVVVNVAYKGSGAIETIETAPFTVHAGSDAWNLIKNASFENGNTADMSVIPPWLAYTSSVGTGIRTKEFARTDEYSMVFTGISPQGGLMQLVPFEPGTYEAVLYFRTSANSVTEGKISWWADLRDKDIVLIKPLVNTEQVAAASSNGDWTELRTTFEVTPEENATWFNFGAYIWDFEAGEKLYIDDVSLRKLNDSPSNG
ncbi:hypothetical protein DQG23_25620 [Paenibacillus contaminans]|uniref:SLH domain-containing protein n=2 Tax=Paenibacillus contaminans TaxID=450362 RepID=A0A329MCW7_9BACL|nr:hypothetical protein DQG23_25620 [Paenibacillus contaminans]